MAIEHSVALIPGSTGTAIDVWDGWEFTIDMLHPGQAWTFHFWHSETRQSTWNQLLTQIKPFDSMRLTIDGATQLSGVIMARVLDGGENGEPIQMIVTGKSLAAIAAKWDVEPTITLRNTTLDAALHSIFDPLRVPITLGVDAATVTQIQQGRRRSPWGATTHTHRNTVDNFHPRPGEKRWACADRLVRKYGMKIWEAPDANNGLSLVVDAPITSGSPTYQFQRIKDASGRTTDASNILKGTHSLNVEDVPTQVQMCSAAGRGDGLPARYLQLLTNSVVFDPRVNVPVVPQLIYRVTEHSRTQDGASQEGQRIIAEANASFETYTAVVQGAAQPVSGQNTIYAVNTVAHVRDDWYGIDSDWLVTGFTCKGSRGDGVLSMIHMCPLGVISLVPEPSS